MTGELFWRLALVVVPLGMATWGFGGGWARRPFGSIAEQQRQERGRRQGRVLCVGLALLGAAHLALYLAR
ncbi:hypothetical protein SAMN05660199_02730 [Klenkia soli]|uniref:Uncharacterized protein n=1 Tax=Klenkia soli TaxID=1052260 RepID=A0A1H0N3P4_9ACTN|nr:hypothetical protein [Klenkia soli]SDO87252.1 hypothetical protein SAMN05660199_02730 [Klenkia soli]